MIDIGKEIREKIMVFMIVVFFGNEINPLGELEIWEKAGHHYRTLKHQKWKHRQRFFWLLLGVANERVRS